MDPRLLKLLGELLSTPGMQKMSQIDAKAQEFGLAAEQISAFVQETCRIVVANQDKPEEIRAFVNHVVEAAIEAGPELAKIAQQMQQQQAPQAGP